MGAIMGEPLPAHPMHSWEEQYSCGETEAGSESEFFLRL